ncbi:4-hydroxy-tetrahydrodipicolinate reductase [Sphingomonas montana]|uniref:4-hydroxy-tetrahydrodipicolinate reductase n=1 Tax=Sphingomonas montana TaxID=1843236 RepID=UPI00096F20D1|nr:4-hydroxy-tetrahydrodipicolinate reductase [Sphingomonas montana]
MDPTPAATPPAFRLGLLGAGGRMGQAILAVAADRGVVVAGGIGRDGAVIGPHADVAALAAACDVLVDFSTPAALAGNLAAACAAGTAIVIGTTGLSAADHAAIDAAARTIPVLQAANTALGVNILAWLVEQAATRLGPDWDIEIVEMHHRHKRDAPSGTALLLGTAAATGRGAALADLSRCDRAAAGPPPGPSAREDGTIGFAALRGGSVAGDHQVVFAGDGERIELGHRAESRAIFARGAVRAAGWLAGRAPGRYAMPDIFAD